LIDHDARREGAVHITARWSGLGIMFGQAIVRSSHSAVNASTVGTLTLRFEVATDERPMWRFELLARRKAGVGRGEASAHRVSLSLLLTVALIAALVCGSFSSTVHAHGLDHGHSAGHHHGHDHDDGEHRHHDDGPDGSSALAHAFLHSASTTSSDLPVAEAGSSLDPDDPHSGLHEHPPAATLGLAALTHWTVGLSSRRLGPPTDEFTIRITLSLFERPPRAA
jgi:hypothetical protein